MRVLLDTCTFLWMLSGDAALSVRARAVILDPASELFLSAASSWEIAIKAALGKIKMRDAPRLVVPAQMSENGIAALEISHSHALRTHDLPRHHADPFDRLLVAQADLEDLVLLSPDRLFRPYDVRVLW
ncbi:MAG: type II toxin-antitoxin system VapC family toxin [Deltaproteobacteria bacterium]|nr:type II toxin-antitoxin system VapC family toxin [Deltaproteobacteria bacterium]